MKDWELEPSCPKVPRAHSSSTDNWPETTSPIPAAAWQAQAPGQLKHSATKKAESQYLSLSTALLPQLPGTSQLASRTDPCSHVPTLSGWFLHLASDASCTYFGFNIEDIVITIHIDSPIRLLRAESVSCVN